MILTGCGRRPLKSRTVDEEQDENGDEEYDPGDSREDNSENAPTPVKILEIDTGGAEGLPLLRGPG